MLAPDEPLLLLGDDPGDFGEVLADALHPRLDERRRLPPVAMLHHGAEAREQDLASLGTGRLQPCDLEPPVRARERVDRAVDLAQLLPIGSGLPGPAGSLLGQGEAAAGIVGPAGPAVGGGGAGPVVGGFEAAGCGDRGTAG